MTTHEAKTHLSQLLARVEKGEEFVICRGRQPVAHLVAATGRPTGRKRPPVGTLTSGPITFCADAFEPLTATELSEWGL